MSRKARGLLWRQESQDSAAGNAFLCGICFLWDFFSPCRGERMAASHPQWFHQEYVLLLDRRVKEGMEAAGSVGWRTAQSSWWSRDSSVLLPSGAGAVWVLPLQ